MMDIVTEFRRKDRPRVLLVEDDPAVRRSTQLLLEAQGLDVRAYAAGAALLADDRAMQAACFVADYRLAEADGITVLRELRRRGWKGGAVLVTAFGSAGLRDRAKIAGFNEIFEKPLNERVLANAVWRLVRQADGAADMTDPGKLRSVENAPRDDK